MYNHPVTTPPSSNTNASGKKTRLLIILLFGLLALVNVAFFMLRKNGDAGPSLLQLSAKEQALSELETEYTAAIAQLDSLKAITPGSTAQIETLQAELAAKRADIEQNIQLKGDLRAARREIDELVQQKDNAMLEIVRLKEKVKNLDEQVVTLTSEKQQHEAEKQQYETGITEVRTQLDEAQTAKAALMAEKMRLEQNNHELNATVEAGKYLAVSSVAVSTVAVNSKGKQKATQSRKMVDEINICFQVSKNAAVPTGEEKFYLKVIDPTGATIYREDQGSGVTTERETGSDFRYTTTATCAYDQQDIQACGRWQVGADRPGKGKYTIEIYNRGRQVGSGVFKIK